MVSSSVSCYRDRTSEFRSLSERLKKSDGFSAATSSEAGSPAILASAGDAAASRSEFNRKASSIGLAIHETSEKIARLAKLAKRSSMFDDPVLEIGELTALIKNDITTLNIAVSDLQLLQNTEVGNGNYSNDSMVHATTICDDLKNKLMGTTKHFKDVLTTRTENLKAHESRKQIFSTNVPRENPFLYKAKTATEPPPWSNTSKATSNLPSQAMPSNGVQSGNQLRRRLAAENTPSQHMEMTMLQQVVPHQETYTQSRAAALQNVESTISELGGIFTQLATMVAQQGELAIRIDDNMDETLVNVDSARSALLKHLSRISSNRWLLIKIFAILILFLLVFIFFVL
ncbi:syntaxin-32-like [Iris pallida]|uniref:Syntaxin-32-like n=1 Tax=Iris pallida TaxID=29817 RepID=A0AAX6EXP8_IRIPA|nr:syntaxin-32-like [Iris pallida]